MCRKTAATVLQVVGPRPLAGGDRMGSTGATSPTSDLARRDVDEGGPAVHRDEVRVGDRHPAALAPVDIDGVGQRVEFRAVEDAEAAERELAAVLEREFGALLAQQACDGAGLREGLCGIGLRLELAREGERLLDQRGRTYTVEERLADLAQHARRLVHAQHELVAHLGEGEGIAAHIGRHVGALAPVAVGIDEEVVAFLHAQQRHEPARLARREHDRIVARGHLGLRRPQRHGVGRAREAVVGRGDVAHVAVRLAAERHRAAIEKRLAHRRSMQDLPPAGQRAYGAGPNRPAPREKHPERTVRMKKLPARAGIVVVPMILAFLMSGIVSGIATVNALGISADLPGQIVRAWALSYLIAFPTAVVVLPIVRRIAALIVEQPGR